MTTALVLLLVGGALLYAGGESLVAGSARLARRAGISPLAIGLTVVAFGTSSPELVVGVDAAVRSMGDIVIGSVIGSNLCNLLLVVGVGALLQPMAVRRRVLRLDIPTLVLVSAGMVLVLLDGVVSRFEGVILAIALVAYVWLCLRRDSEPGAPDGPEAPGVLDRFSSGSLVGAGLLGLAGGAHLFVSGAVDLAAGLGVSQALIAITVVAVGTSLPELVAGAVAALKGHADLAVGNAIGSCVFNILGILGVSAIVQPLAGSGVTAGDLVLAAGAPLLLLPLAWSGLRLSRWEGAFLTGVYAAFVAVRISA